MATVEERLQALEQEHTQLKKTIELQTIAIGALVNKATLEKLNEKYDKLFETLLTHDHLTNKQLAELRGQQIETDGKIVGIQTEMRQRFTEQDSKFAQLQATQIEMQATQTQLQVAQAEHTKLLEKILARLPEK